MSTQFIKLYSKTSEPDSVFFLNDGSVYFYASEMDKYAVRGKNLIVGATEIIMSNFLHTKATRIETAVIDKDSKIKKMPVEKFMSGMNTFSFALNVSIVIAKQVLLTNQIIHKNISQLTGDANKIKDLLIEYYQIVARMKEEFRKRRLPWLNEIASKYETSLTYKKGEAYYKSSEPTKISSINELSGKMTEYSRGSVICEENTKGEEMYILHSGAIDVLVNRNKVATIEEPGTVFGEMALLLNEKRTATLTAKNNVVISKITKENLKDFSKNQGQLLIDISSSLAKKHYYNVIKINSTNRTIVEKTFSDDDKPGDKKTDYDRTKRELRSLQNEIEDISRKKESGFIKDLIKTF